MRHDHPRSDAAQSSSEWQKWGLKPIGNSAESRVGRPEIQKFVGAIHGQRARKGVFITTSSFSSEARNYVEAIDTRIVLIDGEELASLMIDFNVGTSPIESFELKQIDMDYFIEE